MKNKYLRIFAVLAVAIMLPILSGCFTIISVTQQTTADPGEKVTVTLEVRTESTDDNAHFGILGLLVPFDWAVDTVHYSGDFGPDGMSFLHPDSVDGDPGGQVDFWTDSLNLHYPPPAGMNWVVYQANTAYANPAGSPDTNYVDVTVEMTVGNTGGKYNIGYFVSNAALDFGDSTYYSAKLDNPIEVTAPEPVNVTFIVNTSTVPDTITDMANIQLRGDPAPLTWGNDTGGKLTHLSGDYWTTTLQFDPGAELRFKIFADSENDGDSGWEANSGTGSTNREWTVGASDTTLPLMFYNTVNGRDQFYTPFADDNMVDVWFRVNVAGYIDWNPATQEIGVRGGTAPLDWGTSLMLTPEVESENAGQLNYAAANFWSGLISFPQAADTANYQFVVNAAGDPGNVLVWENSLGGFGGNRELKLRADSPDSTLYWKWLGDVAPVIGGGTDTVVVMFHTDVTKAIQDRGFQHGDTLEVGTGYFGSANEVKRKRLLRTGFSNIYEVTDTVVTTIGEDLDYQYYLVKNMADVRENYYDFNFDGSPASRAERRRVQVTGSTMTIEDTEVSQVSARRQPVFPNQSELAQDVLVTWEVDLRPAIYQVMAGDVLNDIQGVVNVDDPDSILAWGVWMNGPAVGGWGNTGGDWGAGLRGNLNKKMYDDGTNGDKVAGDSVYTRQVLASPDSINAGSKGRIGQTYKFGIYGGDNEGGTGGFGNNHVANIDDSGSEFTIFTQFGSINPAFYDAWDFDLKKPAESSAVTQIPGEMPNSYFLGDNYPNPFNPETEFRYGLLKKSNVSIKIYNVSGQLIKTLVNKEQPAGNYVASWRGQDDFGRLVSSGVYFYQISTSQFTDVRKMVLMK